MVAGDIGCTVKLKDVHTGNTLNGKGTENRFNFVKYPNSKYPEYHKHDFDRAYNSAALHSSTIAAYKPTRFRPF